MEPLPEPMFQIRIAVEGHPRIRNRAWVKHCLPRNHRPEPYSTARAANGDNPATPNGDHVRQAEDLDGPRAVIMLPRRYA
jgi:hypothetical protein